MKAVYGRTMLKVCAGCQSHRALYRSHGRIKFHPSNSLCFRCFRSQLDSFHAALVREDG